LTGISAAGQPPTKNRSACSRKSPRRAARGALRYIHLSTHLKTPEILSKAQIGKYNGLRGYSADPCANIPAGHDADMWRKHNKCG